MSQEASSPATELDLDRLLTETDKYGASDLHIRVGMPPMIRVDGDLSPLTGYGPVTREQARDLVAHSITDEQKKRYIESKSLDFSYNVPGVARFRCAYFIQQSLMGMVYRRIPDTIPNLGDIRAPAILLDWSRKRRGLVLITGPTGSGKSTTLASLIDVINMERSEHILTIEEPIEFVHKPKNCVVNQREVGRDVPNFANALRGALRQDPDVILVGEMRDLETIAIALTAAETGHLVFGTLHTSSAPSTIDRVIDQYPADQQQQIRVMLANSLIGVVTQALLPKTDGGRIAVHEVLVANTAVRSHIRHQEMDQVRGVMQINGKLGMQTMDRALAAVVSDGLVAEDVGRSRAIDEADFDQTLSAIRRGGDVFMPPIIQPGEGTMVIEEEGSLAPTQITSQAPPTVAPVSSPISMNDEDDPPPRFE